MTSPSSLHLLPPLVTCFVAIMLHILSICCLQDDYRKAIEEYDEKIYFSLKLICVELRNTYVRDLLNASCVATHHQYS